MENEEIKQRNDELFTALKKYSENSPKYQHVVSEIVKNNQRLVQSIANKYYQMDPTLSNDDLISEGYYGLLRAIKFFEPGKGAFSSFAVPCIKNSIRHFLKYEKRYQKLLLKDDQRVYKDGDKQKLDDTIAAPFNLEEDVIKQDETDRQMVWVRNHLDRLKPNQKEVLIAKYLSEKALKGKALAEEMHYSHTHISRLEDSAITDLQKMYSEEAAITKEEKAEIIKLKEVLKDLIATKLAPQQKMTMLCKFYSATQKPNHQVAQELNLSASGVINSIKAATKKLCTLCDSIKNENQLKSILEFRTEASTKEC